MPKYIFTYILYKNIIFPYIIKCLQVFAAYIDMYTYVPVCIMQCHVHL